MSARREAFAKAALSLKGTPFRLRGSDPATGVDCIGLVAASLRAIGSASPPLPRYTLRNLAVPRLASLLPRAGFCQAQGDIEIGDLVVVRPAPGQFHLAIAATSHSFVHAHAALGRVVECPAPLPWPVCGHWRLT